MGTSTGTFLPDGQFTKLPVAPRTWVDQAAGVRGDTLKAPNLQLDAGGTALWHRQRPIFQGIPTAVQSVPSGTWTAITGFQELIDAYSGHSDTSNTDRYYGPNTGTNDWYLVTGYVPFNDTNAAAVHIAGLRKNGSATIVEGGKIPGGTGHVVDTMVIDLVQMDGSISDYLSLMGWQNTGGAVNTIVSGKTPSLTARWVCIDPASGNAFTPALPGVPHTWIDADQATADATGSSPVAPGVKVPLNRELRDLARFLNNPPIARLTSWTGSQTIPSGSGTWTPINFTTTGESVDNYGGWSNANPSRYTFQRAGLYFVAGMGAISEGDGGSTNTGYRAVRLNHNIAAGGTAQYPGWTCLPQTGTGSTGTALWAVKYVRAAVNDYIEVQMQQTQSGGTTTRTVRNSVGDAAKLIVVWMGL